MSNDTTFKRCPHCQQVKPLTLEYFSPSKRPSGFQMWCKECYRTRAQERREQYRAENLVYTVPIPNGFKVCSTCITLKPATTEYFCASNRGRYKLQSFCKECGAILQREYRKNSPERVKATDQKRNKTPHRRATQNARAREQYNTDEYFKLKHKARMSNQRARLRGVESGVTADELKQQYEKQRGLCYWCDTELNGEFDQDHVIPLSKGGVSTIDNIVCSCEHCNRSKRANLPHEWKNRPR